MSWVKWINLILGILVIAAPFFAGTAANTLALVANIVLGALVIVFAFLLQAFGGKGEAAKTGKA